MSLEHIVEEIKKVKPFAEEDTDSGPSQTLNARRGRKAQAIEQLKRLKREYKQQLMLNTVFIVVAGSGNEEFTKIATEEFGLFSADSDAFYKDLASRVPVVLYKDKEGVSNIFDVLGRHLEDKMSELDVNSYNQLLFKAGYAKTIKTTEEFIELIKQAINQQIGAEVVGIQAIDSLVDVAIDRNHVDKITPVILSVKDEDFASLLVKDLKRLNSKAYLAVAGNVSNDLKATTNLWISKEVTKKQVEGVLKEIRKSIKK